VELSASIKSLLNQTHGDVSKTYRLISQIVIMADSVFPLVRTLIESHVRSHRPMSMSRLTNPYTLATVYQCQCRLKTDTWKDARKETDLSLPRMLVFKSNMSKRSLSKNALSFVERETS
jgi:hypothetical protein